MSNFSAKLILLAKKLEIFKTLPLNLPFWRNLANFHNNFKDSTHGTSWKIVFHKMCTKNSKPWNQHLGLISWFLLIVRVHMCKMKKTRESELKKNAFQAVRHSLKRSNYFASVVQCLILRILNEEIRVEYIFYELYYIYAAFRGRRIII